MKLLSSSAVLSALVLAGSSVAFASPIAYGTLNINAGGGALTPTTFVGDPTSIAFSINKENTSGPTAGTGGLASVTSFQTVPYSSSFTFSSFGTTFASESLFTFKLGTTTETFSADEVTVAGVLNPAYTFYGFVTDGIAADTTAADYILTPDASADGDFSSTLVTSPAPEPSTLVTSPAPEPSSLFLLGTGILGVAGAARRKFYNKK